MEALPESIRVQWSFPSSSRSRVEALPKFCELWQRADSWVPLVYWDSGLSVYPRHYLVVDDLSIIVSYPITSLMLFVHLHIVWYNQILSCLIYDPVSGESSMQWDQVWRLCRPLEGHFPVTAGEGPRHSHRWGIEGIIYACGAPGHTDCCGTHSWTCMVGPSILGFTRAPCVDSLLCYRIDLVA
jgi:hypothetical protein